VTGWRPMPVRVGARARVPAATRADCCTCCRGAAAGGPGQVAATLRRCHSCCCCWRWPCSAPAAVGLQGSCGRAHGMSSGVSCAVKAPAHTCAPATPTAQQPCSLDALTLAAPRAAGRSLAAQVTSAARRWQPRGLRHPASLGVMQPVARDAALLPAALLWVRRCPACVRC
jgi:hypothetical protein